MHIVSLKKGLTVDEALMDPEGIAALGFFLNVCKHPVTVLYLLNFSLVKLIFQISPHPPISLTPPNPKGDRGWKCVWTMEHAHISSDKHHT